MIKGVKNRIIEMNNNQRSRKKSKVETEEEKI